RLGQELLRIPRQKKHGRPGRKYGSRTALDAKHMDQILAVQSNIYDQFHGSNAGREHFFKADHAEAYAAYYTVMYLIQSTGESIQSHMKRGFSSDPWLAYIEFWGVMQAIVIQQDAIKELYEAVIGSKLQITKESDWS